MNPLSLLTKGRTIRGLKERPGAYKLLEKSILPNFSTAKGSVPTISHSDLFKEEARENSQPASAEPQPTEPPKPREPAKPGSWSRLSGWVRQRMPGSKEQPFQSPAIQTELELDKVKVIRNDLSDDDLEVVAIEKKATRREEVEREKTTGNP